MKATVYSITTFLFLFFTFSATAQLRVGINFDYVAAVGNFKENIEGNPYGGGFSLSKIVKDSDFILGVDLNTYSYSNKKYEVDLTHRGFENYIGEQREIDLYHNIQLFLRYKLTDSEQFMPYVEGRVGSSAFASLNIINEDEIAYHNFNLDFHGLALTGGLGTGFMVKPKNFPLTFDFGLVATTGTKTSYKGATTSEENPRPGIYNSSPTNIMFRAGFIFNFNGCKCDCDDKGENVKDLLGTKN